LAAWTPLCDNYRGRVNVLGQILPHGDHVVPGSVDAGESRSVKIRDLVARADPDQALEFLNALHRDARGYVLLTLIARGGGKRVKTGADRWPEARAQLKRDPAWWNFVTDDYARWDTYSAVCSFTRRPARGSRGLAKDAKELPGVFADLDVKPDQEGVFRTVAELNNFLSELPPPSARVNTGSGGAHVYWLLDKRLENDRTGAAQKLLDGWYDTLCARAGTYAIDHVQELSRILRVPGTVRWPRGRVGDVGVPRQVTLAYVNGPRYSYEDLLALSEPHRREAVERHGELCAHWTETRSAQIAWLERIGLSGARRTLLEDLFNRTEDWARLLEPVGWRLTKDRRDGSGTSTDARYWTRPGKEITEGGSASTDSPRGHPGTMYIYTTDPTLEECLIPDGDRFRRITTKYHFALHFHFNGDETALLRSIIEGGGQLG
jgi:hypothetical protein